MKKLSFIVVILFSVLLSSNLRAEIVKKIDPQTACVIFKVGKIVTIYHFDTGLSYYPRYNGKTIVEKLKSPKRTTLIDLENEIPAEAVDMIVGHYDGYYDSFQEENSKLNEKIYKLQYPKNEKAVEDESAKTVTHNANQLLVVVVISCLTFLLLGIIGGIHISRIKANLLAAKEEKETEK